MGVEHHLRVLDLDAADIERVRELLERLEAADADESVDLTAALQRVLRPVLTLLAEGPVAVVPQARELSTGEAAELLGCSRPHVVKLIDDGVLPHRLVGSHRRVPIEAVLEYREATTETREQALNQVLRDIYEHDETTSRAAG